MPFWIILSLLFDGAMISAILQEMVEVSDGLWD